MVSRPAILTTEHQRCPMAKTKLIRVCEACGATFSKPKSIKTCSYSCGQLIRRGSVSERFESQISRSLAPNGCDEWTGAKFKGYGNIGVNGKNTAAHRLSWEMSNGAIPKGMEVLHVCDNPGCVRVSHLFLGTHADNMQDMQKKGRARGLRGSAHYDTHLTESDIHKIRADSRFCKVIGAEYGIAEVTVSHIKTRRTWKHVI